MPGVTDVANVALRLIGQTTITSRTQGTTTANIVDDLFDDLRDDLLRSNPWNFATKRVKLAQSSSTPVFEFDHGYALPSDWLRTVSVHDNDAGHGTMFHRVEFFGTQRSIMTSADAVWIRYIYRVTDPNLWSADFVRAMELGLARDLAVPVASSNTLQDQLSKQFEKKIAQARSSDAMGSFPELRNRGSWASSRGGFRKDDFLSN